MFRRCIFLLLCLIPLTCKAGELIINATVIEVANNYSGGAEFVIKPSGGSGICADTWIVFPETKAGSATTHKHAIATALLAFSTGKKVRVHNYQDNSCFGANFISITN